MCADDPTDDRIWTCPYCGSGQECSHLVAFYETSCPWAASVGCGPVEPEGALPLDALVEINTAFEALLLALLLDDPEEAPGEITLRRDLGIPDRLHAVIEEEFYAAEIDDPENEPWLMRDGYTALGVWREYLHDLLHLNGATETTHHELCIPMNSSAYIAYWSSDAASCARRVGLQLRADASALADAAKQLTQVTPPS